MRWRQFKYLANIKFDLLYNLAGQVYNLDKGLDTTSWQPNLAGIYFKPVMDVIICKKNRAGQISSLKLQKSISRESYKEI